MIRTTIAAFALCALAIASPAAANVHASSDAGFVVRQAALVPASVDETWERLVKPAQWWSAEHSYSGDAANFRLVPDAGGCFCETIPNASDPIGAPEGSVEHMRVVFVQKGRALRMKGGLGPLQAEAVNGTLTVMLKPADAGTEILWEYVVGGYMRMPVPTIAKAVDAVLGQQVQNLAEGLGGDRVVPGGARSVPDQPADETGTPDESDDSSGAGPSKPPLEGR